MDASISSEVSISGAHRFNGAENCQQNTRATSSFPSALTCQPCPGQRGQSVADTFAILAVGLVNRCYRVGRATASTCRRRMPSPALAWREALGRAISIRAANAPDSSIFAAGWLANPACGFRVRTNLAKARGMFRPP